MDERSRLVAAMVEAIPGRDGKIAYQHEAEFHAQVEMLASLWIALGPGLARDAMKRQAEREQLIQSLVRGE